MGKRGTSEITIGRDYRYLILGRLMVRVAMNKVSRRPLLATSVFLDLELGPTDRQTEKKPLKRDAIQNKISNIKDLQPRVFPISLCLVNAMPLQT